MKKRRHLLSYIDSDAIRTHRVNLDFAARKFSKSHLIFFQSFKGLHQVMFPILIPFLAMSGMMIGWCVVPAAVGMATTVRRDV